MPFKKSKRVLNKAYYAVNADTVKATAKQYYTRSKARVIANSRVNTDSARQANLSRTRKINLQQVNKYQDVQHIQVSNKKAVQKHRETNPLQAKCATKKAVQKLRRANPHHTLVASRHAMRKYRTKHSEKAQRSTRLAVAKHYLKDLRNSRIRSKYTSKAWYKKNATIVTLKKRQKYPLAEPCYQVVAQLMTNVAESFYAKNGIAKQIIAGINHHLP